MQSPGCLPANGVWAEGWSSPSGASETDVRPDQSEVAGRAPLDTVSVRAAPTLSPVAEGARQCVRATRAAPAAGRRIGGPVPPTDGSAAIFQALPDPAAPRLPPARRRQESGQLTLPRWLF